MYTHIYIYRCMYEFVPYSIPVLRTATQHSAVQSPRIEELALAVYCGENSGI